MRVRSKVLVGAAMTGMVLACASRASAVEVTIEFNGARFCGELLSEGEGFVEIATEAGPMRLPLAGVQSRRDGACPESGTGKIPVNQDDDAGSEPAQPLAIRLVGSNTIGANLMPDIIESFLEARGYEHGDWERGTADAERVMTGRSGEAEASVSVQAKGSGDAFKALAADEAEIGMSSRPAKKEDAAAIEAARGIDVLAVENEHVLGLDGLAIIVNAENPVDRLSLEQVAQIFAGEITNWSEVGGEAGEIVLNARNEESGTYSTFRDLVLGDLSVAGSAERFESSTSLSNAVSSDPNGIGFTSLASVRKAKALDIVSACGISYAPSEFNVRTEDYALARRLFLYTAEADESTTALVDYALSSDATPLLAEDGFVPLEPVVGTSDYTASRLLDVWRSTPSAPSDRYSEMLIHYGMAVRNASRLSATFRFLRGSAQIDSRGVRDIDRIVSFADSETAAGMTVNFIGFTDDEGSIGQNIRLSEQRAKSIAAQVRERAAERDVPIVIGEAIGVGPVAPVTCNSSDEERQKNRRVEIWLTRD